MLDKVRYDVTALLVFNKIVAPRFITLPSVDCSSFKLDILVSKDTILVRFFLLEVSLFIKVFSSFKTDISSSKLDIYLG